MYIFFVSADKELFNKLESKDGKIPVRIYSNAQKVELFLNGVSLGEKSFIQKTTSDGRTYQEGSDLTDSLYNNAPLYLEWRLDYNAGELKAVAKDSSGNIIATDIVKTAGEPAKIKLNSERTIIDADGYDLCYITVDILDEDGNIVPTADNLITFNISGNAKIVGVDNGNPVSHERYKDTKRKAFSGKALVIVKSEKEAGPFSVSANSSGLKSDTITGYTIEAFGTGEEILGYSAPIVIQTDINVPPVLPTTINAIYSDGSSKEVTITWNKISSDKLVTSGTFEVTGTVSTGATLNVTVLVKGPLGAMEFRVATLIGQMPNLPKKIKILNNDGSEEERNVIWDFVSENKIAKKGKFAVSGTIEGYDKEAIAIVRVTDEEESGNISLSSTTTATFEAGDRVLNIKDGDLSSTSRWTNWIQGGYANAEVDSVSFEFTKEQQINKIGIYFFTDSATKLPKIVDIEYSNDNTNWTNIKTINTGLSVSGENVITFQNAIKAKYLKLKLTSQPKHEEIGKFSPVGLTEVKIYSPSGIAMSGKTATLSEINIDGKPLTGFNKDIFNYSFDLSYGQNMPSITAKANDNASTFIIPPALDGSPAIIRVISEDRNKESTYTISPNKLPTGVKNVTLTTAKTEYTEDDLIDTTLNVTLEDGTELKPSRYNVSYVGESTNGGNVYSSEGKAYALNTGTVNLKALVEYNDVKINSNPILVTIKENKNSKKVISYEEPVLEIKKGETPNFPTMIMATFNEGLAKEVPVKWDEFPNNFSNSYGTYTLQGTVQGQVLKPTIKVKVRDIIAVEKFTTSTPINRIPTMPEKAIVYYSDNTNITQNISWDNINKDDFLLSDKTVVVSGSVEGTDLKTECFIRVSDKTEKTNNISRQWNGSVFPAGIASWSRDSGSNIDTASSLNDQIKSFDSSNYNRWSNFTSSTQFPQVRSDWAGILFANSGVISKQYVNNINVGFVDDLVYDNPERRVGAPKSYTIEYFDGELVDNDIPYDSKDRAHMDSMNSSLSNDDNWKPVTNIEVINGEVTDNRLRNTSDLSVIIGKDAALPSGHMITFNFDTVETYAIRINMTPQTDYRGVAITEFEVFADEVPKNSDYIVNSIKLDGVHLSEFSQEKSEYTVNLANDKLPEITVDVSNNASVTVIPPTTSNGTAKIMIIAENGSSNAKTYNVKFNYDKFEKNIIVIEPSKELQNTIKFLQATSIDVVKGLFPDKVTVGLDTGKKVEIPVKWDMSTFSPNTLKVQIIKGTLTVSQSESELVYNPFNLEVFAKVEAE